VLSKQAAGERLGAAHQGLLLQQQQLAACITLSTAQHHVVSLTTAS
jgi:hypothetical protein